MKPARFRAAIVPRALEREAKKMRAAEDSAARASSM